MNSQRTSKSGGIMDFIEFGDMGSGCDDEHCGFASGSSEDCPNQEYHREEPLGLVTLVCVTVIYIPLMLFGLLGNILTILVVWLRPHMRSSTYLYLSSMAVSDLFILLLLPLDLYKLWGPSPWSFGDIACKLTMFTSECCTFCTILHITFLSIERYIAVCWPIAARTLVTRRRTRVLIGCLWLGAAVSAAPVLVMVGVEEVVGEDPGFGRWRENRVWTGVEGSELKLEGFMLGDRAGGSGGLFSIDGGLDGMKWVESIDEKLMLVEEEKANLETEEREEIKQTAGENKRDKEGGVEEEKFEAKGLQHKREREEENAKGGLDLPDNRECRTTSYAISSGLLSTMTIVSNMYFLLPVCILGLLYTLIGRTLWLRPQNSRREQSHRHTVKMLGVIVLAFILCWLPFHVGRTIFSLSQDSSGDGQEANPKTETHLAMNTLSGSTGRDIYTHTESKTNTNTSTQSEDINMESHLYSHTTLHTTQAGVKHSKTQNLSVSTYTYKPSFTPTHVLTKKRNMTICQNSQTELYNDTSFNSTHAHYYLYCFSQYFNLLTSVLFYLSAAVNPLLYNVMSARYKHAVHSLLHTHAHIQTHRRRTLTGQHSTTTTL